MSKYIINAHKIVCSRFGELEAINLCYLTLESAAVRRIIGTRKAASEFWCRVDVLFPALMSRSVPWYHFDAGHTHLQYSD
jgi:hypothetical protein